MKLEIRSIRPDISVEDWSGRGGWVECVVHLAGEETVACIVYQPTPPLVAGDVLREWTKENGSRIDVDVGLVNPDSYVVWASGHEDREEELVKLLKANAEQIREAVESFLRWGSRTEKRE